MRRQTVWMMAACCLVPVALAVGIGYLSVGRSVTWLISLICPVLMIASIWGMHASENESSCHKEKGKAENR